jgi:hypothetical protein
MPHMRPSAPLAALRAALVLSAGPAFAASDWTIVSAPPTGQNGNLPVVSAVPDSDAWAAGTENGAATVWAGRPCRCTASGKPQSRGTLPRLAI